MKKKVLVSLLLIIVILFSGNYSLFAEDLQHEFGVSLGTVNGYTEYEISGVSFSDDYKFRSLLEFPLDVKMLNISYRNNLSIKSLIIGGMEINFSKNITDNAGTFKDSDWVEPTGIHVKDIIGESPMKAEDITKWNVKIRSEWQQATSNLQYSMHIGYKQDNYGCFLMMQNRLI